MTYRLLFTILLGTFITCNNRFGFKSGVYPIKVDKNTTAYTYCMDEGWTVIQSRGDFGNPVNYFARDWAEYKAGFGKTILTGYARIDGWSVGIVMNNRELVKNGKGEMQFGGVIYSDAADKAARFIMNCNQKNIPLVFIHDVTGFMVGSKSEHQGIIKDGAKMVNAMGVMKDILFN